MGLEFDNVNNKTIDLLRLITSSTVRTKVFESLGDCDKDLNQLKEETGLPGPNILHAIKDLERGLLVVRTNGDYSLSNIGKILVIPLTDLINQIAMLSEQKEFWLSHNTDGIPDHMLKKIGKLYGCRIVTAPPEDIGKPHSILLKRIKESKKVKAVTPIFHKDFLDLMDELLASHASIQVVINDKILKKNLKKNGEPFLELSKRENCSIWKNNNINLGFVVTEKFLAINLFTIGGLFDYGLSGLICDTQEAVEWGNKLFDYFLKTSSKITDFKKAV